MTEEEARDAIVQAVLAWAGDPNIGVPGWRAIKDAAMAYRKATAPPEPFERFVYRWSTGAWDDGFYADDPGTEQINLWRVQVTPIERVR